MKCRWSESINPIHHALNPDALYARLGIHELPGWCDLKCIDSKVSAHARYSKAEFDDTVIDANS